MRNGNGKVRTLGVMLAIVIAAFVVSAGDALPPPAVVRICGEGGNGVWVRRHDLAATIAQLEQQGCFRGDIHFYRIDHEWTFVYGVRLLVGEVVR